MKKLPPEVLASIMAECIFSLNNLTFPSSKTAPLIFEYICREWRSVCLSTPLLWTSLVLQAHHPFNVEKQQRELALWLQRSGSLPLTLKVPYMDLSQQQLASVRVCLTDKLMDFVRRCENLHVTTTNLPLLEQILLAADDAIHLRELSLMTQQALGSDHTKKVQLSHTMASRLHILKNKQVSIGIFAIVKAPGTLCPSLRQLELSERLPWNTLMQWIANCPALEDVSARVVLFDSTNANRSQSINTIVHNSLRRLALAVESFRRDTSNFRDIVNVRIPGLDALTLRLVSDGAIRTGDAQSKSILRHLIVLIFGASADLTKLNLCYFSYVPCDDFAYFLRCLPKLETLELQAGVYSVPMDSIIFALTAQGTRDRNCPMLRKLVIEDVSWNNDDEFARIVAMICSLCNIETDQGLIRGQSESVLSHQTTFLKEFVMMRSGAMELHHEVSLSTGAQQHGEKTVSILLSLKQCRDLLAEQPSVQRCIEQGLVLNIQ